MATKPTLPGEERTSKRIDALLVGVLVRWILKTSFRNWTLSSTSRRLKPPPGSRRNTSTPSTITAAEVRAVAEPRAQCVSKPSRLSHAHKEDDEKMAPKLLRTKMWNQTMSQRCVHKGVGNGGASFCGRAWASDIDRDSDRGVFALRSDGPLLWSHKGAPSHSDGINMPERIHAHRAHQPQQPRRWHFPLTSAL